MRLLAVGESGRGKTTLIKKMIKAIQAKHKHSITLVFSDYGEEFNDLKKKKHAVIIFPKEYLEKVIEMIQNEEDEEIRMMPKVVIIDDSTSITNLKNMPEFLKMLTQLRHINANVIIASHYINAMPIQIKQHMTDFILFGGVSPEKLKMLWDQKLSNTLNSKSYGYNDFKDTYENHCQGVNLKFDDKEGLQNVFHNYVQISLPSLEDPTKKVIQGNTMEKEGEQFSVKNAI